MPNTSAKDVAIDLDELLDRLARNGERIVVERDGRPAAILAPLEEPAARRDPAPSGLAASEAHLKAIIDHAPVDIGLKDAIGRYVVVSRRFQELNGVTNDEVAGKTAYDIYPEESARAIEAQDAEVLRTGQASEREIEVPREDGLHTYLVVKFPIVDSEGRVTGIGTVSSDITERKRDQVALREAYDDLEARVAARTEELTEANRALRAREAQLRQAHQITQLGHWSWYPETDRLSVSPEMAAILGASSEELTELTNEGYLEQFVHPDDRVRVTEFSKTPTEAGDRFDLEYRLIGRDGAERWVQELGEAVVDGSGRAIGGVGTIQDITGRKRAETALRESEERFRGIFEQGAVGIAVMSPEGQFVQVNQAYCNFIGYRAEDLAGRHFRQVIHPDDLSRAIAHWDAAMAGATIAPGNERRYRHKSGDVLWGLASLTVLRDPEGAVTGYLVQVQDITELRESEARLRQSQKMEAIGQLTGGVAHDFNNLLGVIMGNAEMLADAIGEDDENIGAILRATVHGAELTERLLAFSRRQALAPQAVNLDELIQDMTGLLVRTLGETIEVATSTTPNLWPVKADPGQLENALINLAINARDAMPGGGKLVIETVNAPLHDPIAAEPCGVPTGDYVSLLVTDNGAGMSPEVLARAADPFFTTKEVGAGSGLGLSMVDGFARQSGGFTTIESTPGEGTMVKLALPRALEEPARPTPESPAPEPRAHDETVLVVEDDPDVRDLAVAVLERLGYQVVEAQDGKSAIEILQRPEHIHLILSDVVLPGGMSGPELVAKGKDWQPDVKALFMSGYATDALTEAGQLDAQIGLLNKPFRRAELAERVRAALDDPETGS